MNKTNRVYEFDGMEMTKDLLRGWMLKTHPVHIYRELRDVEFGYILTAMLSSKGVFGVAHKALAKFLYDFVSHKYNVLQLEIADGKVFVLCPNGWFYLTVNNTRNVIFTRLKYLTKNELETLIQNYILPESLMEQLHAYAKSRENIENAWFKVFYSEADKCWYIASKPNGEPAKLSDVLKHTLSIGETILPFLDFDIHMSLINELTPFLGSIKGLGARREMIGVIEIKQLDLTVFKDSQGKYFGLFEDLYSNIWLELHSWPRVFLNQINEMNPGTETDSDVQTIINLVHELFSTKTNSTQSNKKEATMENVNSNIIRIPSGVISKENRGEKVEWFFTPAAYQEENFYQIPVRLLIPGQLDAVLSQVKVDSNLAVEFLQYVRECFGIGLPSVSRASDLNSGFVSHGMSNPSGFGVGQFAPQTSVPKTNSPVAPQAMFIPPLPQKDPSLLLTQMLSMVPVGTVFNLGYCTVSLAAIGWELKTSTGVVAGKELKEVINLIINKFW